MEKKEEENQNRNININEFHLLLHHVMLLGALSQWVDHIIGGFETQGL